MIKQILAARNRVQSNHPLIHCITNPISINDCANVILSTGGRPIMAEHKKEVAEITATAQALAVNLGNITDARMESMLCSGRVAREKNIPQIIDLVGVSCSPLRLEFAKQYITTCKPQILKGNMTEIKTMMGQKIKGSGVDARKEDLMTDGNLLEYKKMGIKLAKETSSVIMATGAIDLICDETDCFAIYNGIPLLGNITGSGCMLTALTAVYLSSTTPYYAAIGGMLHLEIAAERSKQTEGMATFHISLLDQISLLKDDTIKEAARIKGVMG